MYLIVNLYVIKTTYCVTMRVDLLSSITWSKMTRQPQWLHPARYHLCWGLCSPQPAPSQWPHKADTEVGHSWETHGSSDDDFGLRATEDSSQLCWLFLVLPQSFFQQTVSFFPLSFTLGQTCIVVGWVSSFYLPCPIFTHWFFPFPEQFNPILISAYLRTQMNIRTIC